ncbi:MAG: hypothetical protein WBG17_11475 [Burkholderiaceae bacterium]
MQLSADTLDALRQLVEHDAALQARIRGAGEVGEVVGILTPAASLQGIEVQPSTLTAWLQAVVESTAPRMLCDAQLDAVAGGAQAPLARSAPFDFLGAVLRAGRAF